MAFKKKQASGWGTAIAAVFVTVVLGFWAVPLSVTYFAGDSVNAQVDNCETTTSYRKGRKRTSTTCYGTWTTADGKSHSGEIDGAGAEDEGKQVAVRARGDAAVVDDIVSLWPAGLFCVLLLGCVIGIPLFVAKRRANKQPESGVTVGQGAVAGSGLPGRPPQGQPPTPPPGYPGGPPPGYPPQGYPPTPPPGHPGGPPPGYPPQGAPPGYPGGPPPGYPGGPPPGYPGGPPPGHPSQGYPPQGRPPPPPGNPGGPPPGYPPAGTQGGYPGQGGYPR